MFVGASAGQSLSVPLHDLVTRLEYPSFIFINAGHKLNGIASHFVMQKSLFALQV